MWQFNEVPFVYVNAVNIIHDTHTSTEKVSFCQRRDCARSQRLPLDQPSTTPARAQRASERGGLQGTMRDGPDRPVAARHAPNAGENASKTPGTSAA